MNYGGNISPPRNTIFYVRFYSQKNLRNDSLNSTNPQQREEEALTSFYRALELAKKVGIIGSISESQHSIFEIYHEKAMLDSALKYHLPHTEKLNVPVMIGTKLFEPEGGKAFGMRVFADPNKRFKIQFIFSAVQKYQQLA